MKIALSQINQVIGDFDGNLHRIETAVRQAEKSGADLIVFPETAATGPFPGDLLVYDKFVRDNLELLDRLVQKARSIGVLLGYVRPSTRGNKLENAAALIADGQILSTHVKNRLAVRGAYDEFRYFEPGDSIKPVDFRGVRLGITICEDIYRPDAPDARHSGGIATDPAAAAVSRGAEILINMAATPFFLENRAARRDLLKDCAAAHRRPLLFVNHVGGHDEWVFDGDSLALDAEGKIVARAESFEEALLIVDIETEEQDGADLELEEETDAETVVRALILGTRDFVRKRGAESVLLEMDGGVNSSTAAAVAAAALGASRVHGITFDPPSEQTSVNVLDLAACLGIRLDRYEDEAAFLLRETGWMPFSKGIDKAALFEHGRLAGRRMMLETAARAGGHLLVGADDKTDLYLKGPSLLLAEFSMLSDLPKSLLWKAARQLGEMGIPAFQDISDKKPDLSFVLPLFSKAAPSSLEQVDLILNYCSVQRFDPETIVSLGFDASLTAQIVQMVQKTKWPRRRAPLKLNLTTQPSKYFPYLPLNQWKSWR